MKNWKHIRIIILAAVFFITSGSVLVFAQTATPAPTSSSNTAELQKRIDELQKKVTDLKAQSNTLSSQISLMDNQINITEYRINATEQQIEELTKNIGVATKRMENLEGSLNDVSKVLINRISATYKVGSVPPIQILFTSTDAKDFFSRLSYLRLVQQHDKRLMYETQQARNDYANQKNIFEDEKRRVEELQTQLQDYTKQLDQQKAEKQKLLAETQGSEQTYQKLLSQARAQLAGFSRFATSQGGASILPPQASPDGWFYNQRDERWGNNSIGLSGEPVWKYGCLLTSAAMLLKQAGENVTPLDIAANSGHFFADTAYMRIPWVSGRFTSVWSADIGAIDGKLAAGKPVILGLNAGAYGTHFIVVKSGSGGNYVMNDPWHGANLNFTDYYSTGQIFQYGYLN